MRINVLLVTVICLWFLAAPSLANDAVDVFRKSQVSDKYVNYRGMKTATLCCGNGETTAVFKVVHLRPDKTRTEYFAPALLSGIIVIHDGPNTWHYSPSHQIWNQIRSLRPRQGESLSEKALGNFSLRIVGFETLAGRPVYQLHASPKTPDEYARRLWIDRDHYLVMGTQVEDASGRVINTSRFTQIEINPSDISPSIFRVSGNVEKSMKPAASPPFKVVKPTYVPAGYKFIGQSVLMVQDSPCVHLQYSNGASTISLFQRKADSASAAAKVHGKLLNVYTWTSGDIQFTLIGNVPRGELQKMAVSLP